MLDSLTVAVPDPAPGHPVGLSAAAWPGRTRGVGVEILTKIQGAPARADGVLREFLRDARALHSRERRLVAESVFDLLRYGDLVDLVGGVDPVGPNAALARWLGWLVASGLPSDEAGAAWRDADAGPPPDFAALQAFHPSACRAIGALDPVAAVARVAGVPGEVAARLIADLGLDVGPFVAASNQRAPMGLRANTTLATRDQVARRLADEGVPTRPSQWATDALIAAAGVDLNGVAAFRDGWVEVQDEGSQVVVDLARGLVAAEHVIDWCAGAGGKALALAAAWPRAHVLALDTRPAALDELARRARRARAHGRVEAAALHPDGRVPKKLSGRARGADVVLVDAPCTGTGTLRRHPELRLRLDERRILGLSRVQAEILDHASRAVRPGGFLVYATCSVLADENERVVERFLDDHPDFVLVPAERALGARAHELGDGRVVQVAPHRHGTDAFFAAAMERRAGA